MHHVQCQETELCYFSYRKLGIFELTDVNKYLIGRFMFVFVMCYSTIFVHVTMNFMPTIQGQHSIFTFLLQRNLQNLESESQVWKEISSKGIYPDFRMYIC